MLVHDAGKQISLPHGDVFSCQELENPDNVLIYLFETVNVTVFIERKKYLNPGL